MGKLWCSLLFLAVAQWSVCSGWSGAWARMRGGAASEGPSEGPLSPGRGPQGPRTALGRPVAVGTDKCSCGGPLGIFFALYFHSLEDCAERREACGKSLLPACCRPVVCPTIC